MVYMSTIENGCGSLPLNVIYEELRDLPRRPRLHPNGFIQLDLTDDMSMRLHVWPDNKDEYLIGQSQKTLHSIHDHSFDMESEILTGCLTNLIYEFQYSEYNVQTVLYQAQRLLGGQDTVLAPAPIRMNSGYLRLSGLRSGIYTPGTNYRLPKRILHDSIPHGLTATIMKKIAMSNYSPLIAVPKGVEPDNTTRRESPDEEYLWEYIRRALDKASHEKDAVHKDYSR